MHNFTLQYVIAVTANSITLSAAPGGSGTSITTNGYTQSAGAGNGGTLIGDNAGNCFARVQPNPDVRAWRARCDVQSVDSGDGAVWDASHHWIKVADAHIPTTPKQYQYVAIAQIGNPPQWADRWSTLTNAGSNYSVGDLISFAGASSGYGTFSQQVAIVVDQVKKVGATSGVIAKWHFLSGGQYTALPTNDMTQDTSHSFTTAGTGATLSAQWSGWSVVDQGTAIASGGSGTGFSPGDTVTFGLAGGTVIQGHYPKLLVTGTSGGAVGGFQWLDYGSFSAVPSSTNLVESSSSGGGTLLQLVPEWGRGTLATTINTVNTPTGYTEIIPTDFPTDAPDGMPIEAFYYGDDDGPNINSALASTPNGASVHVTGYCGTTIPIILPNNSGSTTPANAMLVGDDYKSSGIFAFGPPPSTRGYDSSHVPIMNHLVYGGPSVAFGGGMRNLELEGMGIPQGTGYYGSQTAPSGTYTGPTVPVLLCTSSVCVPDSGSVVEIDGAKETFFSDLAIYNAYGEGNAEFQAGFAEADPTGVNSEDFGSVFMDSDRFAVSHNLQGALDPEYALYMPSAHDSQFSNLIAFDGTEADAYQVKGSIFSGLHIESDVLNGSHGTAAPALTIDWSHIAPFAGVAIYGFETAGNVVSLSGMQCDTVYGSCVFIGTSASAGGADADDTPTTVTNIAQKCSGFKNVWPTYYGVEIPAGASGIAVSNVTSGPGCDVPSNQLVHLDGPTNPSVQAVFQNSGTQTCSPSLGFQSGRYYTMPFTAPSVLVIAANTLYAIPFQIPCAMQVSSLSVYVNTGASSKSCRLGIYGNNGAGQPGALVVDAGTASVAAAGTATRTFGPVSVAPGLVFLVAGCNGAPTLNSGSGTLIGSLLGFGSPTDTNVAVYGSWTYSTGSLPSTFPTPVTYTTATTPLVFASP